MHIIDTNFLIALHDGQEPAMALAQTLRRDVLVVPEVVAAEFITDWRTPDDRESAMAALEQDFTIAYGDRRWVLAVASLRATLRRRKAMVRSSDLWIAGWASLYDAPVVTHNVTDFAALGVETKTW